MSMVTEDQANAWLGEQVGKHLDYDQQYGQQCFDFFNYYYQFVTTEGPFADGYEIAYAKDIWTVPTDLFDKIPDSNSLQPNVGDILVYGPAWGGGYGHIEVCRWSDAGGCHVIGENEHNNTNEGVVEVYRSWASMRGLLGVMRPHFTVPTPPQSDPVPTPTPEPTPDPVVTIPDEPVVTPTPTPPEPVIPTTPVPVAVPTTKQLAVAVWTSIAALVAAVVAWIHS